MPEAAAVLAGRELPRCPIDAGETVPTDQDRFGTWYRCLICSTTFAEE